MNINEIINLTLLNENLVLKYEDSYLNVSSYNDKFIFFESSDKPQTIKDILVSLKIEDKKFNHKFFDKTCIYKKENKYYFIMIMDKKENTIEVNIREV